MALDDDIEWSRRRVAARLAERRREARSIRKKWNSRKRKAAREALDAASDDQIVVKGQRKTFVAHHALNDTGGLR